MSLKKMTNKEQTEADFAASIMQDMMGGSKTSPKPVTTPISNINEPNQVDISEVEVPDSFIQAIHESTKVIEDNSEALLESKKKEFISRINRLKNEARELIKEMTTCGMLGVNLAGPTEPKKKKKRKKVKK